MHHLIAKDILKPHAIYWPTILKADAGLDPFRQLNVHGYWQIAAGKMSKSLGNVVEPLALAEFYGVDQVRYFFLREMVFGLDATFSEEALHTRINSDLANDLGNLFARSLGMAFKYRQGVVPAPGDSRPEDVEVAALARETAAEFLRLFPELEFPKALAKVWEFVGHLNRYIVTTAPWELAKDPAARPRLDTVLYNLLESLRWLAVLLRPVMPGSTLAMAERLGLTTPGWDSPLAAVLQWGGLSPKTTLRHMRSLYPRLVQARPFFKLHHDRRTNQGLAPAGPEPADGGRRPPGGPGPPGNSPPISRPRPPLPHPRRHAGHLRLPPGARHL